MKLAKTYPIRLVCRLLGVPRSSVYYPVQAPLADEAMLKVLTDTTTGTLSGTFYQYDAQGKITMVANPSAVALPATAGYSTIVRSERLA